MGLLIADSGRMNVDVEKRIYTCSYISQSIQGIWCMAMFPPDSGQQEELRSSRLA